MIRFAAAALMWGAVTLGACSGEQLAASRDAGVETPTPVDALAVDRCTGSLSDVGGRCQPSFDGNAADLPPCSDLFQRVQLCGDLIALVGGSGFTSLTCYYDRGNHLLVGALEGSDSPGFCGDSFGRFAGQIPTTPTACHTISSLFFASCSNRDAGAD